MQHRSFVVLICLLSLIMRIHAAPVLQVIKTNQPGLSLLRNGSFEEVQNGTMGSWQVFHKGFRSAPGEGRNGSYAIVCENRASEGEYGASQVLSLNSTVAAPLVVRGWSKAED